MANEHTSRRPCYLVVVAPSRDTPEVRYRLLQTDGQLAVGDALFLDERLMRVSAIGEAPEEDDATVIVSPAPGHGT